MKIMASGPITPWEIDGETVGTVSDFILGGSKITADSDCSHEEITHVQGKRNPRELEKVGFNSNPKERQCQRMLKLPHNCPHLTL